MLINNSYRDPEITKTINDTVGKPFTLRERILMGGIGSPKLPITATSMEIHNLLVVNNSIKTCNIEMRPNGIIIGFNVRLETYVLLIPYYKLTVYKGKAEEYSFYKDSYFIKIRATAKDKAIHAFVKKVIKYKSENAPDSIDGY